jgi:hypothetical protein
MLSQNKIISIRTNHEKEVLPPFFIIHKSITKMKLNFGKPTLAKLKAARTSIKRIIRHSLGFKAPRGLGWLTNSKRTAYNQIYNRTSAGCLADMPLIMTGFSFILIFYSALFFDYVLLH